MQGRRGCRNNRQKGISTGVITADGQTIVPKTRMLQILLKDPEPLLDENELIFLSRKAVGRYHFDIVVVFWLQEGATSVADQN